jgi:putative ABC transport system permease protein
VVTRVPKLRALDRKLLRDLWLMKGQALAIGLVVASGVAMFVAYRSTFHSLRRTRETYYDQRRFAHVFAACKRAPLRLQERIAALPGVAVAELRVVADVTLDVAGLREPATGRLISIPARGEPRLNAVYLRRGRFPEAGRPDEVLASEGFALAHRLEPGDALTAIVNGKRRRLRVVGLALSPEYVYTIPPGDLIPDDRRFGVLWMERRALASAFDMQGGFNDVALALRPGASQDEVLAGLDHLLEPYGGLGAIPRALQISHWTLDNEFIQLQNFGLIVPAIFLGVAAFLLNVALTRALAIQRAQIAALKALGYSDAAIGWHYVKWALVIAGAGWVVGVGVGAWLGSGMLGLYNDFFRFPLLLYRLSTHVALLALAVALLAAGLGAVFAVRRAVRVPPAEAMRPEAPARFRPSAVERTRLGRRLTHTTRMVLRNVERHPVRSLTSLVGIAFAVGILLLGFVFVDAMAQVADTQFAFGARQDVTVGFVEPASWRALHELRALPGVSAVEPFRSVPARLRAGHRERRVALTGRTASPRLQRVVDQAGRPALLPAEGLLVSRVLAEILHVRVGEPVTVEVLVGRRAVRDVPVVGVIDDAMGLAAHMELGALQRLLGEGPSLSGGELLVDPARLDELYARLKALPRVAGVTVLDLALQAFRRIMAQNFQIITWFNVGFALIIAFGVVYNAARVSLSERERELASLRVLGFTLAEIALVLLGELALLTLLALPVGALVGYVLSKLVMALFQNELYRIPATITAQKVAISFLVVVLAALFSGLAVRRKLYHLDLVGVLKTRE